MQATFIVKVLRKENATWQGMTDWIDQDGSTRTRSFRSALELIRLMDSALEDGSSSPAWEAPERASPDA